MILALRIHVIGAKMLPNRVKYNESILTWTFFNKNLRGGGHITRLKVGKIGILDKNYGKARPNAERTF